MAAVPLAAAAAVVVATAGPAAAAATPVLGRKIIGFSVKHRPIVAYHLGNPRSTRTAVILGQMHGDEHAGVVVANSIIHGRLSIEGINLWVIPTMNPDGNAAHRRQNAHRVDLNRNWPRRWRHLTGQYYSGTKPLSEPETRAVFRFLRAVRPKRLLVLHQPLHGVDTTDGGRIDRAFVNRLSRNLGYPKKAFNCWSVCYGSLTDWYTARRLGLGFTVEFGWHPSRAFLTGRARTGIIRALGGRFGSLAAHDPRSSLTGAVSGASTVQLRGWAYDPDARGTSLRYAVYRDGSLLGRGTASRPSSVLNQQYGLTGAHGIAIDTTAAPGRHVYCLTFANLGAGTGDRRRCVAVTLPAPPASPS